ncbi:MAG: hypothetical protein J6S21_02120, partial [Victivallales bacterium]|nr:hypothetical protein [Victivallales bacterium]
MKSVTLTLLLCCAALALPAQEWSIRIVNGTMAGDLQGGTVFAPGIDMEGISEGGAAQIWLNTGGETLQNLSLLLLRPAEGVKFRGIDYNLAQLADEKCAAYAAADSGSEYLFRVGALPGEAALLENDGGEVLLGTVFYSADASASIGISRCLSALALADDGNASIHDRREHAVVTVEGVQEVPAFTFGTRENAVVQAVEDTPQEIAPDDAELFLCRFWNPAAAAVVSGSEAEFTAAVLSDPAAGNVAVQDGKILFTPAQNYCSASEDKVLIRYTAAWTRRPEFAVSGEIAVTVSAMADPTEAELTSWNISMQEGTAPAGSAEFAISDPDGSCDIRRPYLEVLD